MDRSGPNCTELDQTGPNWTELDRSILDPEVGPKRTSAIHFGFTQGSARGGRRPKWARRRWARRGGGEVGPKWARAWARAIITNAYPILTEGFSPTIVTELYPTCPTCCFQSVR